jgi:hypothetical protein
MTVENFFGEWSIDQKVFGWILSNLQRDSHILELGSGYATGELARYYNMHSIEQDKSFIDNHKSHYIYAPIVNDWYDIKILQEELPKIKYDLLLIDGPNSCNRLKFMDNIGLFNMFAKIIIDDCQETHIKDMADKLSHDLNRPGIILYGTKKMAMVIA